MSEDKESLARGQRRDVPVWTWVTLARDEGAYKAGEQVGLNIGNQVEIIGTDARFGLLVRYNIADAAPRHTPPMGLRSTHCYDNGLVFLLAETVEQWPPAGKVKAEQLDEAVAREEAVRRLLREAAR